jgi:hypothetical protein
MLNETDEWPPKRARSMEDWDAYWARQRWDRRWRHNHLNPWWWRVKRRLAVPRRTWREIRWFAQRGRRGWAACDLWSMDSYICQLLGEMATRMRETAHGHPCNPNGDQASCGGLPGNDPCSCEQDWNDILDSVSGPLLAYKTHWDYPDGETTQQHLAREAKVIADAQDALRKLADVLPSLWD